MIKKLLLLSFFIFANCFGMDKNSKQADPFAWIDQEFAKPASQPQIQAPKPENDKEIVEQKSDSNEVKPNQFVLHWGTDKTKLIEKYINISIQRAAVICGSSVLAVFSAKLIMQKNPSFKAFFGLVASLSSVIYNKEIVKILNTKTGKASFVAFMLIYLHKEIAKTLLTKEIFNLIYKKG